MWNKGDSMADQEIGINFVSGKMICIWFDTHYYLKHLNLIILNSLKVSSLF